MKRLIAFMLLVAGAFALSTLSGVASADEELEDYLQEAADAEYEGSEIVISYWEDETIAAIYDVQQSGGMTKVDGSDGEAMAGDGVLEANTRGGVSHTVVSEWAEWRLHDRYALGDPRSTIRLGRSATSISVLEGGLVRMRLIIDNETGAALRTQVFDGEGEIYRLSLLLEFRPEAAPMTMDFEPSSEYTVAGADTPTTMPDAAAGYWRADTYAGPDSGIQIFYTDGLFSFSVFEYPGEAGRGPFESAGKWKVDGHTYRRISDPGAVRLFWMSSEATYVLVGDLPPDHLQAVLDEMPRPERRGLISRVWRGLFG